MTLRFVNYITLPPGARPAGYGRPGLHEGTDRLYIPMTDDDALAVVDCIQNRYMHAIPDLQGITGVLAPDDGDTLLATLPASSQVVAIEPGQDRVVAALTVGGTPQELAYDPKRGHVLIAFADRLPDSDRFRVAIVDIEAQSIIGDVQVPGSTRQVLYDRQSDMFYIVVAEPAQIVVLDAGSPTRVAHAFEIVGTPGLRGIALGYRGTELFCACDDSSLLAVDRRSGRLLSRSAIDGRPDTVLFNPNQNHLYVGIGGAVEVFDTVVMTSLGRSEIERGARHLAFDQARNRLYAVLPESRRVAVYDDGG